MIDRSTPTTTAEHIWSNISETTGPISTKFLHKLGYNPGHNILKDEVWIPTVSWENPFFVSKLEHKMAPMLDLFTDDVTKCPDVQADDGGKHKNEGF